MSQVLGDISASEFVIHIEKPLGHNETPYTQEYANGKIKQVLKNKKGKTSLAASVIVEEKGIAKVQKQNKFNKEIGRI